MYAVVSSEVITMYHLMLDESGQSTVEYVLILAALALALIATVGMFGSAIRDLYDEITDAIVNA